MKKILAAAGLLVTVINLTVAAGYSAVCESTSGARACGSSCAALANGECGCSGNCTSDELRWVEGAKKGGGDEELLVM